MPKKRKRLPKDLAYFKARVGNQVYWELRERFSKEYIQTVAATSWKAVLKRQEREKKELLKRAKAFRTEEGGKLGKSELASEIRRLRAQKPKVPEPVRTYYAPSLARRGYYDVIQKGKTIRQVRGLKKFKRLAARTRYLDKVDAIAKSAEITRGEAIHVLASAKRRAEVEVRRKLKTKKVKAYLKKHPKSRKYSIQKARQSAEIMVWKAAGVEGSP
jgi:hypothetical protein